MKLFNKKQQEQSLIAAKKLSARLPDILLEAQNIATTVLRGEHGRRQAGSGDHFWQYRTYEPTADAAGRIDWRRSAKSDQHFVRELEEERPQTASFWVDPASSMHYSSEPKKISTKYEYAFILAAALGYSLTERGERIMVENHKQKTVSHPKSMLKWADQMISARPKADFTDLKHTRIIIISDFLNVTEADFSKISNQCKQHSLSLTVIVPIDPAEREYPFEGHVKFETLDGQQDFETQNAKNLKNDYQSRLKAHHDKIVHYFGMQNCFFVTTDQSLPKTALKVMTHIMKR